MKKILIPILSLLSSINCFAEGGKVGNGGSTALIDGKYYLIDLIEAGIEKSASLPSKESVDRLNQICDSNSSYREYNTACQYWDTRIPYYFEKYLSEDSWKKLLTLIDETDDLDALVLFKSIIYFDWRFVDKPLVSINDIESPIDLSKLDVYQTATRKDNTITINTRIWNNMTEENKVALILHELLYSLVRPVPTSDGKFMDQDSWKARKVTASYFGEVRRLREYLTDNYDFTIYNTSFGNYGEADDFIGHDVIDGGSLVNRTFIESGAYFVVKLSNRSGKNEIIREKLTFLKGDADHYCNMANSNATSLELNLVRTKFTLLPKKYASKDGYFGYLDVEPKEESFDEWYGNVLKYGKSKFSISTTKVIQCIQQFNKAVKSAEATMKKVPDNRKRWFGAH